MRFVNGIGPDYPRNCPGYVYVLAAKHGGVKVGRSTNPEQRLKAINRAKSIDAQIVHCVHFDDCDRAEQRVHSALAAWRLSNEWYSCTVEMAISAVDALVKVPS